MRTVKSTLLSGLILVMLSLTAQAIDVSLTSSAGEAFPTGVTVTFFANATNTNSVTTYTWDFDDGSQSVTTSAPMIDHVFTEADLYTVAVSVDNGVDAPGGDSGFYEVFDAPTPSDPIGANAGDPDDLSPDDGITFKLNTSQGGYIAGLLSLDAQHTSLDDAFLTDFGDGVSDRNGLILQHRYLDSGIFILQTDHLQGGSDAGFLRKTLAFSDTEIYGVNSDPLVMNLGLPQRKLNFKTIKGKFNFAANNAPFKRPANAGRAGSVNDTVTLTWTTVLPAGFDITTQIVDLAVGNVFESVPLTKSGVGMIDQPSSFKSVRIKFPRPKKNQTRSATPFPTLVSVQMLSEDLPSQGFDTEGITPRQFLSTGAKGPFGRSIQVATIFAGVSYSGVASVSLSIQSNGDFGTISGRSKK